MSSTQLLPVWATCKSPLARLERRPVERTWFHAMTTPSAIDIHTHIVPARFPAYAGKHTNVRWPRMAAGSDCRHCNVMIAGKVFRTVTDECWNVDRRLEAMAASRVARQV